MEVKVGCAVVRLHGTPDRERLKAASEQFMKKAIAARKKAKKAVNENVQNG